MKREQSNQSGDATGKRSTNNIRELSGEQSAEEGTQKAEKRK